MPEFLVVLSGDIKPVNNLEGTYTLLRCKAALKAWKTNRYDYLVVSGGQCHPRSIETQPAAITMEEWFKRRGVAEDKVFIEPCARDTFENAYWVIRHVKYMMTTYHSDSESAHITVVTHWLHAIRFAIICKRAHSKPVKRIGLHYPIPLMAWIMEWIGIVYTLFDPAGTGPTAQRIRGERTHTP